MEVLYILWFREIERREQGKTKRLHCFTRALHEEGFDGIKMSGKFTWCFEGFTEAEDAQFTAAMVKGLKRSNPAYRNAVNNGF